VPETPSEPIFLQALAFSKNTLKSSVLRQNTTRHPVRREVPVPKMDIANEKVRDCFPGAALCLKLRG
jgi:hypothetical protein